MAWMPALMTCSVKETNLRCRYRGHDAEQTTGPEACTQSSNETEKTTCSWTHGKALPLRAEDLIVLGGQAGRAKLHHADKCAREDDNIECRCR